MHLRIHFLLLGAILVGCAIADEPQGHAFSTRDDIYIDDEDAVEGSGAGRHDAKDHDLESSGSGYGPDDEDGDGGSVYKPEHKKPGLGIKNEDIIRQHIPPSEAEPPVVHPDGDAPVFTTGEKVPPLPEDNSDDLESSGSGYGPDDEDGDGGSGDSPPPIYKPEHKKPGLGIKNEDIIRQHIPPSEAEPPVVHPDGDAPVFTTGEKVPPLPEDNSDDNHQGNDVYIMNRTPDERATSFFAQPGILAAVIGGAVVGLLCAILVVMFIVYRMRKKDEGSYALDEPKRSPTVNSYTKNSNREFYA